MPITVNQDMARNADGAYKNAPLNTKLDEIPGNFGLPFLGHAAAFYQDAKGLIDGLFEKYGPICKYNIMGNKGVLVHDPDVFKEIYLDKYKNFSNEKAFENTLGKFFQGGLLLIDFDEHKAQRRIFQSAFKNDAMKNYVETMNRIMAEYIDSWDGQSEFLFYPNIKKCLLTTASEIFMGVTDKDEIMYMHKNFVDMFEGMMGLIQIEIPGTKWAKAKTALRNLRNKYESLIPERRANEDGKDFLSYLAKEKREDGSYFSNEEIVNHMNFLLMAAHDTTTASLTNIMMEIAKDTEWQERLRKQAFAMDKQFIDYDDLDSMIDFDNAMLEAQRMHPSVPVVWRRSIRECTINGYDIPPNTIVWMPLMQNYRDPQWFTNPNSFDPDRFNPERAEHKKHSFAFVPFGGGAHKCIGMHFAKIQVKCFLFQYLKRYRFTVEEGYDPRCLVIPMPKPADDLPLKVEPVNPADYQ